MLGMDPRWAGPTGKLSLPGGLAEGETQEQPFTAPQKVWLSLNPHVRPPRSLAWASMANLQEGGVSPWAAGGDPRYLQVGFGVECLEHEVEPTFLDRAPRTGFGGWGSHRTPHFWFLGCTVHPQWELGLLVHGTGVPHPKGHLGCVLARARAAA